ncbi:hypothetical protein PF005_g3641 [Phytophthora fragariae]|uniref:Uncharacterized protein n=1 Tax=Phytophthora fragariae TaxID=53985 RepID=A0A6A3ULV7_9STRA|nr:hypothetical protein PF003_g30958 [Phytophthora fragariae]KAE8946150.1 hypothetical protein PF009_g4199 [Phytophthora fragariae]KAE9131926.1 hypothetical protein PF007_g3922 [Phytophthora fragariae]KAE9132102.1 hypothetical protein PF010_g3310 [Phytophthora fragariae]KAE9152506.1 hypothetical protein PF006_g3290 [Phytophthora fragariae]
MVDKSELVAFEREKRLYKDAYVENFRSVRYFPSLATIGAGKTDGDSIVLVQEPQLPASAATESSPPRGRYDDVASRLIPPDSLEEIFDATLPLTTFRSAVMCKHAKARQERRAAAASSSRASLPAAPSRYGAHSTLPGVFKHTSAVEAKGAIQRRVAYDGQPFEDKPYSARSVTPRVDAPQWANNNPASARREICGQTFFNVPAKGPVKVDRRYTQEFIRLSMEAYHAGQRHAAADATAKRDPRRDY